MSPVPGLSNIFFVLKGRYCHSLTATTYFSLSNPTWCTDWVAIETSFKFKATFGFVMFMTASSKFLLVTSQEFTENSLMGRQRSNLV